MRWISIKLGIMAAQMPHHGAHRTLSPAKNTPTLQAYAVASTQRTSRWPTIPDAALLEEIGKRVVNSRTEYIDGDGPKAVKPHTHQPQRTDLETQITQRPEPFIQITFAPLV